MRAVNLALFVLGILTEGRLWDGAVAQTVISLAQLLGGVR